MSDFASKTTRRTTPAAPGTARHLQRAQRPERNPTLAALLALRLAVEEFFRPKVRLAPCPKCVGRSHVPGAKTLAAMRELDEGKSKTFRTIAELFAELNSPDEDEPRPRRRRRRPRAKSRPKLEVLRRGLAARITIADAVARVRARRLRAKPPHAGKARAAPLVAPEESPSFHELSALVERGKARTMHEALRVWREDRVQSSARSAYVGTPPSVPASAYPPKRPKKPSEPEQVRASSVEGAEELLARGEAILAEVAFAPGEVPTQVELPTSSFVATPKVALYAPSPDTASAERLDAEFRRSMTRIDELCAEIARREDAPNA